MEPDPTRSFRLKAIAVCVVFVGGLTYTIVDPDLSSLSTDSPARTAAPPVTVEGKDEGAIEAIAAVGSAQEDLESIKTRLHETIVQLGLASTVEEQNEAIGEALKACEEAVVLTDELRVVFEDTAWSPVMEDSTTMIGFLYGAQNNEFFRCGKMIPNLPTVEAAAKLQSTLNTVEDFRSKQEPYFEVFWAMARHIYGVAQR